MASSSTATQNQNAFVQLAPCSAPKSTEPWDIFINHRGSDVKCTLAKTIHHKLHSLGFHVFLDVDALDAGDSIPAEIQQAITCAAFHLAIFSLNYAQSPWCLAELSFMLQTGKTIIPIYYHVDPSDLRWVEKGKYADAFSEHESTVRYTIEKLHEWKGALHNTSFLSGYLVNSNEDEATVLKNIVHRALAIMKKTPLWVAEHPLGLDELVSTRLRIVSSRRDGKKQVDRGHGRQWENHIGQGALQQELFLLSEMQFYFRRTRRSIQTQKKLLADLNFHHSPFDHVDKGKVILANRLSSHGALIILDDVDHIDQLNAFLPSKNSLGSQSMVIVTTRELGVLLSWGI